MRYLLALFSLFCFSLSFAAETNQPIVIESQKLNYNKREHKATYIGSVIAQKGDMVIKGDKLIVYFDSTDKFVEKVEVVGNVRMLKKDGEGTCKKLEYYPSEEKVILIGDAKLKKDNNTVMGDRIVAYKDGTVNVEGIKQKVKTVIFTTEKKVEQR
jgi:lipopolysaccharide export system protein LptA